MEGGPDRKIKLDRSPGVDEVMLPMFSELHSISATFSFLFIEFQFVEAL